jgi:hypothetical protein
MTTKKQNVWEVLSHIDCSEHTEQKGDLTYLSWAWAYKILKDNFPDMTVHKHWFDYGGPTNETVPAHKLPYAMDRNGWAYVMVTVTINALEATEIMPVLNYNNKPVQKPNSFEVNTALQRTLAKAAALHGLGINLYTGEDLVAEEEEGSVIPLKLIKEETAEEEPNEETAIQEVSEKAKKEKPAPKSLDDWREAFRDHPDGVVTEENGSIVFAEGKNESGWKMIKQIVAVFVPRIKDQQEDKDRYKNNEACVKAVELFFKTNRKTITLLSKENPSIHEEVMEIFRAAKQAAKQGKEYPLPINKD